MTVNIRCQDHRNRHRTCTLTLLNETVGKKNTVSYSPWVDGLENAKLFWAQFESAPITHYTTNRSLAAVSPAPGVLQWIARGRVGVVEWATRGVGVVLRYGLIPSVSPCRTIESYNYCDNNISAAKACSDDTLSNTEDPSWVRKCERRIKERYGSLRHQSCRCGH